MERFFIFRKGLFSFIFEKKSILILFITAILCIFSIMASLSIGEKFISFLDLPKIVFSNKIGGDSLIVNTIRMPRTMAALVVGISLGLSGAILQGIVKNPLAAPNIIGTTDGGSVGALIFLTLFTDTRNNTLSVSIFYMPPFAFAGALAASIIVYFFAFKKGVTPYRLIMIGIAITGAAKAITSMLIINGPPVFIKESQTWITGTVYGTRLSQVKLIFILFIIIYIITIVYTRELNLQNLDDDVAINLGSKIEKNRLILMILSAILASGAVVLGGGISFIGLIAPHIARKLTNSSYGNILTLSALIGGIIVVLSDIAARNLFYPMDLPVGIFTAAIGAPFFMYILIKNKKKLRG